MRTFGKVKEYNGYNGYIKGIDGKDYVIIPNEVNPVDKLKINDNVHFEPETFETLETKAEVARFIKKLEKKRE